MRSQTREGKEEGLYLYYLYCFFQAGTPFSVEKKGIDGENRVFPLSYGDLGALVSRVPFAEYSEEALEKSLQDLKWIAPRVKRHEEVIKTAMGFSPVIPVRFCTLYKSRERVLEVLRSHYEDFRAFLDFVQDKEEWGVKIYGDGAATERLVQKATPALRALNDRMSSASTGESYFLKKRRERILREEMERTLDELAEEVYAKISSRSVASQRNRLLDRRATGRNEEMTLNAAFLIEKNKVGGFVGWLDRLAAGYKRQGLFFEVSGPWPPYNFCPQVRGVSNGKKRGQRV